MTSDSQATQILPRDSRPSFSSGDVLRGRYRLDSQIGRGGMGVVYRATDLELHRRVAVKVISENSSDDARERLIREARAAAALNHPHIVSVYDVGEANGLPFFVMELVEGPSLSKTPPTELSRIVELGLQICAALEHAHTNNIVHRDLKPDNVLVSTTGQSIKLADLGLALPGHGARISRAGLVLGTPSYMAPEQALGHEVDARTDLYALGVLLYELTTGRVPFKGDDPLAVVSQHVHAPAVPPRVLRPDVPRPLEILILRLLEKNPAARFQTATEVAAALHNCLDENAVEGDADAAPAVAILDALSRGRLIGRATELAEVRQLWQRALDGHGHAVLLSGEPGAGKTRLARELAIQAAVDGAVVLTGGCYEYEATTPYLPFVEAFRRFVREVKDDERLRTILGDDAPQIAKLAPEIETRLGPFHARTELAPHEERLLFFDAVVQVLSNLARSKGLLFYADDLHWADRGTLWLLTHLLRQMREERALIVGCYRETELDRAHPLSRALLDWNRERLVTRITLRRFEAAETNEQLSALLGESVSADFGEAVHRETEGNPFFVEEVLKALIEQGSVRRESGRWRRCDVGELVIPQSVKEAIGSRLDRVSEQTNDVLRVAAVLGKTFSFEELQAAAGNLSEDVLLDALDESTTAQLINSSGTESFTFTHDKIREVLYEELNPIRRRRLHRHAAEGLERRGVPSENDRHGVTSACAVERLAYHYIHAGDYEHGLTYAKQAAAAAEKVFAFDEAIAAYTRARDCAEALGLIEDQVVLEEAIGKTYLMHGESIAAGEHFERAMALTEDRHVRARLQTEVAGSFVTIGDQRGMNYLHEALKVLDPEKDPLETANAIANEARFHHLAAGHRQAIELLNRAAELVEPFAAADSVSTFAAPIISQVYTYLAGAYQHYGLYDDSNAWAQRAIDFGERHNVSFAQAAGIEFLAENGMHTGNYAASLENALRERVIAERIHSRERRAWTNFSAALSSFLLGDFERSEREYTEGITLAETIGERRVLLLLKADYAVLLAAKGAQLGREDEEGRRLLDAALDTAQQALAASDAPGLFYMRFESFRCLIHVQIYRNEMDEAEATCRAATDLIASTESRVSKLWLGPTYIDIVLENAARLEKQGNQAEATSKRSFARELLTEYQQLVSECQSPRFTKEAAELAEKMRAMTAVS
jgi:predicted ATPase